MIHVYRLVSKVVIAISYCNGAAHSPHGLLSECTHDLSGHIVRNADHGRNRLLLFAPLWLPLVVASYELWWRLDRVMHDMQRRIEKQRSWICGLP